MERIYKDFTELIGRTPLFEIKKTAKNHKCEARILAKLEYFNPCGSIKDRIAKEIIIAAEKSGILKKGATIIEPTSGNTGISLAGIAAARGYGLILTMPEPVSLQRRSLIAAYGAKIVLTSRVLGMKGAIDKANELALRIQNAFIPSQFENPSNLLAHKKSTGPEIWYDTGGKADILVAGVGTGGTITGAGEYLRERNPHIKVIAVEPATSAVLSGEIAGPHQLQGIGAGFIPEMLNMDIIDEVVKVYNQEAFDMRREVTKTEGFLIGISSAAAIFAAVKIGKRAENLGKNIIVILPDSGERYLSVPDFI